jgi:hypothetical protein
VNGVEFDGGDVERIRVAVDYAFRMEDSLSRHGTAQSRAHHSVEARAWWMLLEKVDRMWWKS